MDEILRKLAEHSGISEETARNGLGAILAFAKEHLPEGLAGQLQQALPDAEKLTTSFEENKAPAASSGLLGVVSGLASKFLGGGAADASKLTGMLGQAGLGLEQVPTFVPKALELLKDHIPAEIFEKIVGLIPGLGGDAQKA
jgi:Protein of unknown function VcgC/VcgE (DUF2780)